MLTQLEANFTILLPLYNALKPRFSEHKSIGFTSQKLSFCMLKAKLLCNSLIMSRYKMENKKRVTNWLLLKFLELP